MRPLPGLLAAACLTAAAVAARAPPVPAWETDRGPPATVDLELKAPQPSSAVGAAKDQRTASGEGGNATAEAEKTGGGSAATAEGGIPTTPAERSDDHRSATAEGGGSRAPAESTDENHSAFAGWVGWATTKAGKPTGIKPPMNTDGLLPSEIAAEFFPTMLFVIVGCGSACGIANKEGSAWVLQVALTFGLAITMLDCATGHYTGGQINCAVTFGLVLAKKLCPFQGFLYLLAQLGGSVAGALALRVMYPDSSKDRTGSLGSNCVNEGFSIVSALLGEVLGTFVLMYVVMETANRTIAPLAIGFAVFLAHSVLIPIDGCSINPTRSFGPAVVATLTLPSGTNHFRDMWIFWVGPLIGTTLAIGVYSLMAA